MKCTVYLGTHMPNWLEWSDAPLFISRRRLADRKRPIGLIEVLPPKRKQLAPPNSRQYRKPDHRPAERRQSLEQQRRLMGRQGPLRSDGPQGW